MPGRMPSRLQLPCCIQSDGSRAAALGPASLHALGDQSFCKGKLCCMRRSACQVCICMLSSAPLVCIQAVLSRQAAPPSKSCSALWRGAHRGRAMESTSACQPLVP